MIMTESQRQEIIQKLIIECKWHFDNANNYYLYEAEFKRREKDIVKPLGLKLYESGGLRLMREIYELVEQKCLANYSKNCRSALDMRWNGIGEWRG
ncbi:MAG: hypothetical protein PF517_07455 [Salinivirgaceae bacterium]|jgi:hypothetical protein|nr:hypothetical protein [Salinivirgaceae bacterium]